MNQTNIVMLAILIALGRYDIAGLIAIPAIDQAQASTSRNKGQQGELSSDSKRQNHRSGVGCSTWDPLC